MTHNQEPQGGFWTFDGEQESMFDTPTLQELVEQWKFSHQTDTMPLQNGYGIYEPTSDSPTAFVSLDLCEVVRQTGNSLQLFLYPHADALLASNPSATLAYNDFYSKWQGCETSSQDYNRLALQQIMHNKHVLPVPFADAIQVFLQRWKEAGVYTIANTSTLPGCERSTIEFLSEHYPSSVRGILFPRNHDGQGKITKPSILSELKQELQEISSNDVESIPTIAIEDGEHHVRAFLEDPNLHIFTPEYFWNRQFDGTPMVSRIQQGLGTIDTFIAVDNHFRAHGIVK